MRNYLKSITLNDVTLAAAISTGCFLGLMGSRYLRNLLERKEQGLLVDKGTRSMTPEDEKYSRMFNYTQGWHSIHTEDYDNDGLVDEAFRFRNPPKELPINIGNLKPSEYEHLVAPGFMSKYDTPNTREMTAEERDILSIIRENLGLEGIK